MFDRLATVEIAAFRLRVMVLADEDYEQMQVNRPVRQNDGGYQNRQSSKGGNEQERGT